MREPSEYPALEPLTYRWRARGNKHWTYNPSRAWIEDHRHMTGLEIEPLYGPDVVGPLRNQLVLAKDALREFVEAYKHQDCASYQDEMARAYGIADANLSLPSWLTMSLILTGDQNNVSQELTDAEVNHLRRLLGWLTCEYNLSEAGHEGMFIGLSAAVACGVPVERAQAILDEEAARIRHVPAYIRHAIKMLTKAVRDHDAKTRVIAAKTIGICEK